MVSWIVITCFLIQLVTARRKEKAEIMLLSINLFPVIGKKIRKNMQQACVISLNLDFQNLNKGLQIFFSAIDNQ